MSAPVEKLQGTTLSGGWVVAERIIRDTGATGGSRSSCYRAVRGTKHAFVKAFDFRGEERNRSIDSLKEMADEFVNERSLLEYCKLHGLTRITTIIDWGQVTVDDQVVHYILCEYAKASFRERLPPGEAGGSFAEKMKAIRQIAAALEQLHSKDVAHQDVKPSNAIYHNSIYKLSDLGSGSCLHLPSAPHDARNYAGQPCYAPYELLYNELGPWSQRRIGCDLFLLGNLTFTSIVGHSITSVIIHSLPEKLRPLPISSVRFDEVLPDLIEQHSVLLPYFVKAYVPEIVSGELTALIDSMCHPDPNRRGHPKNLLKGGPQYGLERYISRFEYLSKKLEVNERVAA